MNSRSRCLLLAFLAGLVGAELERSSCQVRLKEWTIEAQRFDSVPDVDGDGFRELLYVNVAYPDYRSSHGLLRMVSGATGKLLFEITGSRFQERLGDGLTVIGDATGDGFPDFLTQDGLSIRSFVHDGRNGSILRELPYRYLSAGPMADLNGDGVDEVFMSAVVRDGATFDIYLGFPYRQPEGTDPYNDPVQALAYRSVVTIGDVTGDGVPDVAAGAPGDIYFGEHPGDGYVFVYSGVPREDQVAEELYWLKAPGEDVRLDSPDSFGEALAAPGDLNGDGIPDLAVAGAGAGPYSTPGTVFFFDGPTGELIRAVAARGRQEIALGRELHAAGDVNGNGFGDVLVVFDDTYLPPPRPFFSSIVDGKTLAVLYTVAGSPCTKSAGHDWNDDGFPDFVVTGTRTDFDYDCALYSGAPPGVTTIGRPCPPDTGPRIGCEGIPVPGASYPIHLSQAPPDQNAVLLIGPARTQGASPAGPGAQERCALRIHPIAARLWTRTETIRPGEGGVTAHLDVPLDRDVIGTVVLAQWAVRDPATPRGWSYSRVLRIEFQAPAPPEVPELELVPLDPASIPVRSR